MDHIIRTWGWRERFVRYRLALSHLGFNALLQRRKASRVGNTTIRPRNSEHPLFIRAGTSDIYVFEQIFVEREYRCLDGLRGIETIVDAGANVGFASAYLLSRFKNSKVIAIEPDSQNVRALERNLLPWKERAIVLEGAVWSENCMLDLRNDGPTDAWARQVHKVDGGRVPAYDMTTILKSHGIERLDLLKMDIEGA
nr:FkbM family methyltransferase [uncultured Sphingomonas sp.]